MIAKSPALRLIYDDRAKEAKDRFSDLKDARTQGLSEGLAEGRDQGKLIGQIQAFLLLLGEEQLSDERLAEMDPEALRGSADEFRKRIVRRGDRDLILPQSKSLPGR